MGDLKATNLTRRLNCSMVSLSKSQTVCSRSLSSPVTDEILQTYIWLTSTNH